MKSRYRREIEGSITIGENGSITYDDVEVDPLENAQLRRNVKKRFEVGENGIEIKRDTIDSANSNPGLVSVTHEETDETRQTQKYTYTALRHGENMASIQPEYSAVSTAAQLWEETKNHQQFVDEMRKHFPELYGIDEDSVIKRNEAIKKKIENSHYYGNYGYKQKSALESYVREPNEKDEEDIR